MHLGTTSHDRNAADLLYLPKFLATLPAHCKDALRCEEALKILPLLNNFGIRGNRTRSSHKLREQLDSNLSGLSTRPTRKSEVIMVRVKTSRLPAYIKIFASFNKQNVLTVFISHLRLEFYRFKRVLEKYCFVRLTNNPN